MAEPKRILASFLTQDQEFQRLQADDAQRAAVREGLQIEVLFADNNAVLQIQQLYTAIHAASDARPAAIVVETVAGEGLERVARKAAATGIGWVLINRTVPYLEDLRKLHPRLALSSVGTDQLEVGRIQGAQIKLLAPRGGTVLCITGPRDTSVAQERLAGLQQLVKPMGIEVKVLEGRWTEASGAEALRRWMRLETSRGNVPSAIACQNDSMALGVRKALESQLGSVVARRVPVTGCDGLENGGRRLVDEGTLTATIVTPSNGGPAVQLVARALRSDVVLPPSVMLPPVAYPSMDRLWRRMGDVPRMGEARPSP
jgi:ABC-type sugar transport system substrate-binding protein